MTNTPQDFEKITAADVEPGDYISRTRTAPPRKVISVSPSSIAIYIALEGAGRIRPRATSPLWRLKPRLKASLSPETRRELGQVTNQATADRVNRSESVRAARELATVAAGAIGAGEDPPANPALQEESLAAVTEGLSMLPDNRWEVWLFTKPAPNWSGGCHGRSYFTDAAAIGQHYRGACELGPGRIVTAAEEARWTGDPKRVYLLNGLYIEIRYLAPPRIAA